MGGSSSKNINNDKIESYKGDDNETMYKDKKEQKEIIDKNYINNKKINNNSNCNNLKQIDDISNDIEEFTLDKNGLLIKEKNLIKLTLVPKIQLEKEITENAPILTYNDIIKEEEEEIITLYSEKESLKIITNFYDDFIELIYCFKSRKTFIALSKSLNQKYLCKLKVKKFPNTKECQAFLVSLKYASIIIVCLIFLCKDFSLFVNSAQKIKENIEHFIFTSLDNIDRTIVFSLKIINFMQRFKKNKKTFFGCTNSIIKNLFKNEISYKHILNCLEQILLTKINESILFYYNASNYIKSNISNNNNNNLFNKTNIDNRTDDNIGVNNYTFRGVKKKVIRNARSCSKIKKNVISITNVEKNQTEINKDDNDNNNNYKKNKTEAISAPFIKEELNKKFCLVLDIDETLSHMIKLPFGIYFLVRPGVIDLLKELHNYYEIDIFTAALKHYADNILNKLDRDNNYISYRLYRSHCTYEDGKPVKKLSLIGRDLNKIVFVDDIKENAKYNMKNLVLVSKWIDNLYDNEIITLKNKLKFIALCGKYDEDITKGLLEEKVSIDVDI